MQLIFHWFMLLKYDWFFISFFNYKCFSYAIEILSWSPYTKVWFTKWKLYQWYWRIIAWRRRHISRPYIILIYALFFIFLHLNLMLITFSFGFCFLCKLCNLFFINLWYLRLFSYESCFYDMFSIINVSFTQLNFYLGHIS